MSTEEKRKILDEIKKTGYPLEVNVTRQLMEKGWSVFPQFVYSDETTEKLRTIDILAVRLPEELSKQPIEKLNLFLQGLKTSRLPILLVECKTSKKPWVFFTIPFRFGDAVQRFKGSIDMNLLLSHMITLGSLFRPFMEIPGLHRTREKTDKCISELGNFHFLDSNLPRAYSCHIPFRGGSKEDAPNDFERAIYQLRGASLGLAQSFPKTALHLAIVLRGKLFEYKETGKLESAKHLIFTTFQTFPGKLKPVEDWIPPVMIDIVVDTYFSDYLEKLKRDYEVLKRIQRILEE